MGKNPKEIKREWASNPRRAIFIIDEVREPEPGVGEFVTFCCVCLRADDALRLQTAMDGIRASMPPQSQLRSFKGSVLFGARKSKAHEPVRTIAISALMSTCDVALLVSNRREIASVFAGSAGGITAVAEPGEGQGGRIRGPELLPLLSFLKKTANDLDLGNVQVDVVVDRSAQFGFDPQVRNLADEQFEALEAKTFNTLSDGRDAALICPSAFRLIVCSETEEEFRDLLMLPDVIGYLGRQANSFEGAKERVRGGEQFWMYHPDLSGLRAGLKRNALQVVADRLIQLFLRRDRHD